MIDFDDGNYGEEWEDKSIPIDVRMEVLMSYYDVFMDYALDMQERYKKEKSEYLTRAKSMGLDDEKAQEVVDRALEQIWKNCGLDGHLGLILDDCKMIAHDSIRQYKLSGIAPEDVEQLAGCVADAYWLALGTELE